MFAHPTPAADRDPSWLPPSGHQGLPWPVVYRFALRPRWLLSHLLVLALVVVMVAACLWQLDRRGERAEANALVRARTSEPVVDIGGLAGPDDPYSVGDEVELRVATATGEWDPGNDIIVRGRTLDGGPGFWILTPLRLDGSDGDGRDRVGVLVNRGFVAFSGVPDELDPVAQVETGAGATVTGLVQATQIREGLGQRDPADGVLETVSRVDVARIAEQVPYPLLPVWLQLESVDPADADGVPIPLARPALDGGPHLSYAFQWAVFSLIAIGGYPMILRREARRRAREAGDDDDGDEVVRGVGDDTVRPVETRAPVG